MKTILKLLAGVLLLSVMEVNVIFAQSLNMGDLLPMDTTVRMGKLDNGMAYYLRHNAKEKGLADFYIVYDVGAVQEDDSQAGLAHFLEHMAFNGTVNFPGNSMVRWLESIGMQFGTNLNAATGMEMTYYQLTQVPLKREGVIDSMLLILHDWSGSLALKDKEIDKERGVIIEELRQRSNAAFRMGRQAAPYVYGDTRYAQRDMLGTEEYLRTFKSKTLRDFYKKWYRPDLQAIVVVGDFDVNQMERKLKQVMSDIPVAQNPASKEVIRIPDNAKPAVALLTDPEERVSKANFYIRRMSVPKEMNNRVGATYMNLSINVATALMNTRFMDLSQQEGCPFAQAALVNIPLTNTCDALELRVVARGNAIAEAFTSAYGELERVRRFGFTQEEFETVRTNILRGGKYAYETAGERGNSALAWECINHYVKNTPLMSPKHFWALTQLLLLKQMNLDQINELMQRLISPANNVLVITAPESVKASLPPAAALENFFSWVTTAEMEPYKTKTVDMPLLEGEIAGGKVVKNQKGAYGSTVWTLGNGARVVVMPTTDMPAQIVMSAQADGGLSMVKDEDYFTASLLASVIQASGVGNFSQEQLQKLMRTKSVMLQPGIGRFLTEFKGQGAKADIETLLQLTYLYFTSPRFDREKFDRLIEANRLNLKNTAGLSDFVMTQEMNKLTYRAQVRTQIPDEEVLAGIDFDKMPGIYQNFFTDAVHNYTFYFLGDIDLNTFKPLVEKYIGGLPAGSQELSWKDDGVHTVAGKQSKRLEVPMATARSLVNIAYTGKLAYTQENLMLVSMLATYLQGKYNQAIREERGGSYGVTVNGMLERLPAGEYSLKISFQTNPDMVDELVEVVKNELIRIAKEGPDKEELAKHLEYWRKMKEQNGNSTQSRMVLLQTYYMWGEDWDVDYGKLLKNIVPDKIKKLAAKMLADGNLKEIVLNPEK